MTDRLGVVSEEDNTFAVSSVLNTTTHLITDHTDRCPVSLVLTTTVDTNTQTHTDTHTDRQTNRQIQRHRDTQRQTEI